MKKILLVQPPMEEFYITRKRTIPYGLASICASLEKKGYPTQIFDALATDKSKIIEYPEEFSHLEHFYGREDISLFSLFHKFYHFGYSYEHIGTLVRRKKPFLVGISSLFSAYCDQALFTAQAIKKFYPKALIVIGGHHPTLFPKEVLDCKAIDFVLRGEGEISLPLLCDALVAGGDLKKIPGIAFKDKDKDKDKDKIFINSPAWIKDFKSIPLPALTKVNQAYYQRNNKASITMVSSRGCPMSCSYCSVSATSSHAKFRQRDVEDVLEEIETQARRLDIGFIDFEDENLTLNKNWILTLLSGLDEIFKGKPVELRAMNGLYPPSLDREIIGAMKKSGFKTLNLSLGSFSKKQLQRFKRPDVRKAHDRALGFAQELGLNCVSYVIAAAPGQNAKSSLNDLLFLAQKRTLAGLSIFYPAPGSLDYELCRTQCLLPGKFSLMRSTALPLDEKTTRLEAITLLRLARILNYIKNCIDNQGVLPLAEPCIIETIPCPYDNTANTASANSSTSSVMANSTNSSAMANSTNSSARANSTNSSAREANTVRANRETISHKLVQWFLNDGIIRGLDKKGNVYTHETDQKLSKNFIHEIKKNPLMGVIKGPLSL
jgi:anaerobic magnesium-protoporphyrin IX monomethyl ester cyclase